MENLLNTLKALPNIVLLTIVLRRNADFAVPTSLSASPIHTADLEQLRELTIKATGPSKTQFQNHHAARDRLLARLTFSNAVKVNRLG